MRVLVAAIVALACVAGLALATGYGAGIGYGHGMGYSKGGYGKTIALPYYGLGDRNDGGFGNGSFLSLIGLLFLLAIIFPLLFNNSNSITVINATSS